MDDVSATATATATAASATATTPAKKSTNTLSVDRAAFLLLRVKKAFKKKRQQRKEKQLQITNSGLAAQGRAGRKVPPPLLRSRTLPAIIVPGIPVVSLHTDRTQFQLEDRVFGSKPNNTRCWSSLLTRNPGVSTSTATTPCGSGYYNVTSYGIGGNNNNNNSTIKSLNLPRDDSTLVYRRKSSGSSPHSALVSSVVQQQQQQQNQQQQQQQQPSSLQQMSGGGGGGGGVGSSGLHMSDTAVAIVASAASTSFATSGAYVPTYYDDFECQADGSLLLRIPAPHVVAARAYRLASKKRNAASTTGNASDYRAAELPQTPNCFDCSSVAGSHSGSGGSGNANSGNSAYNNQPSITSSACSTTALTRLAKLLHQSSTTSATNLMATTKAQHQHQQQQQQQQQVQQIGSDYIFPIGVDETPRRLSWERRKDSSALQRSASIDSFAEIVFSDSPRPSLDIPRPAVPFSKRPSASSLFSNCSISSTAQLNINYGDGSSICGSGISGSNSRRESMLSPSSTRRNKLTRIINDNIFPPSTSSILTQHQAQLRQLLNLDVGDNNYSSNIINNNNKNHRDDFDYDNRVTNDDDFVILRKTKASSLKYYNHNAYCNSSHSNNSSSGSSNNNNYNNNNHKSKSKNNHNNKSNKHQYNHELPLYDKFERDNSANSCYNHNNNNNTNNNNNNCNKNNNNNAFRWSAGQQLSNNVATVAKIRHVISYNSKDSKEMEFLLPQHHNTTTNSHASNANAAMTTTSHKSKSSSSSSSNNNNNNNNNRSSSSSISNHGNQHTSIAEQASKLLHISRHSLHFNSNHNHNHNHINNYNNNVSSTNESSNITSAAGGTTSTTSTLAAISSVQNNIVPNENHPQGLAIHRQPAHARTKCGSTPPKMSKKQLKLAQAQLDKLSQINLHLHALFSAVEHGHLDKARTILESTDVDVNSINADGLSALDVAVLSNNRSMTKMLLQHGAVEGSQFSNDTIGTKLNGLLKDAESRIHDLSGPADTPGPPQFTSRPSISSIIIGNTSSSVTGCTGNEIDKQIGIWERRVKGLRRMLLGWDQTTRPDAPASVTVDVTGENSIALQILEPFEGAIGTKFKVQWSTRADFSNIVGERELIDWSSFHGNMGAQCHISGLTQGRRYFVRSACGNVKGWGPYKTSVPASIVPSCWRDLNNREDRYLGRQRALDNLFTAVRLARPADVSELTLETTNVQRRNPKKKTTIKQLFSVASKFQKNLRRGIYLASIIYCEDKVLVTSEDFLPVIEIDETYPGSLHSDYHWLMKVACTWDDVKSLRTDMERNLTSAVHFRTKLLSAVCQMQSALGLNDLGQLYYKPLRDTQGTVVLSCIQAVRSQKSVSILNSRWLPVNKLQKKVVALLEDYNINDMLISSIGEQIHYHQASMHRLAPGLYLGYLKMQCSVDQIQVVVPIKTPNVLPHYKVRDNSHITAEEWQTLKRGSNCDRATENMGGGAMINNLPLQLELSVNNETTTEVQRLFLYDLTNAAHKLFNYMNIKAEEAATHRLYDVEVIEHSKDISFLIICPSVELTCAAPGQSELLLQRDDLASLSIQAFEMIHLRTYQTGIIQKYARLSCILELDTALANHSQREAFSTSELQTAKERLAKLHELSANLNMVWKSVRWLMDVIAFARDKTAQPSIAMREILDFSHVSKEISSGSTTKQQLLQLPIRDVKFTKSGSGRGSWPGNSSNTAHSKDSLEAEHSKSEQNLGLTAVTPTSNASNSTPSPQMVPTTKVTTLPCGSEQVLLKVSKHPHNSSDISLRKNSGDSLNSQSYYSGAESAASSNNELGAIFAIPPSRSDDTLALTSNEMGKYSRAGTTVQRKRTSSNITYTSATTPLITVHNSSSAPYLAHDIHGSSVSLKSASSYSNTSEISTLNTNETKSSAGIIKAKAASSVNLRDTGAHYLKTTLSALQSEIKNVTADEKVATSTKSLSRQSSEEDNAAGGGLTEQASGSSSGIIQVYTAYQTGLTSGTSLKLHVTPKTTAREVINLVVKQLNMAAVLKGNNGPIYTTEMLDNFCLVAVIGARERCLRDDFKPLQLQNPWKKGRLYVRQKHELLAAIEHSNRKSHLI